MPKVPKKTKELTRKQKLSKYGIPKEILVGKDIIMYSSDTYEPGELIERIESFCTKYPNCPKKIIELEQTEDYYDSYHNLVGFATRPLTKDEEDVLIAKGEELAEKKNRTYEKAKEKYIEELKKKYPNYQLPSDSLDLQDPLD